MADGSARRRAMKSVREEIVEALEAVFEIKHANRVSCEWIADAIIAGRIPHVAIVEKPTQHG